jgi:hypothetical protein
MKISGLESVIFINEQNKGAIGGCTGDVYIYSDICTGMYVCTYL